MERNLFSLRELEINEINSLLNRAMAFKNGEVSHFPDRIVGNLFFEPSTRTHQSFIMAEKKMGMQNMDLFPEGSSLKKGESLYDTAKTYEAIGADALVIRSKEDKYYEALRGKLSIPVLNGGDGSGDHPTQSLLDLLTIREEFGSFEGLKVLIAGDISHSRVAHSNMEVMERLGMKVYQSAPEIFQEKKRTYHDMDEIIGEMDIVMMLRVQHERHEVKSVVDCESYNRDYGMNEKRISLMKPSAILMHPAPVNRGWEVTDEVVECEKSRIMRQMRNGVYVRMAVLERALAEGNS
ncbi:aspartate carbamoyltransferase catalytic subunit [Proteiniclasticum sp. SCR006]|uniref:Aspartate carbamoyltransferase n=1 Tax=Proteiniclasticum aestuarii TaxID=2817862 RepID=A0A939KGH9_9CLOT|nr:aspartate carbamoyltransferase catalytic subunit [Proteiniclasticum aestuarii]MBO1265542.1 aspartate carbamoyltransferase catalytic subunit [Proteiniclasticum aestuarii]